MKSFAEWAKLIESGGSSFGEGDRGRGEMEEGPAMKQYRRDYDDMVKLTSKAGYMDWLRDFESKFHTGDYKGDKMDRDSLYTGRVAWVLDELGGGEHNKFWDYVGGVNSAEKNYHMLLDRLVKRDYPHMYEMWKLDHPSPEGV